MFSLDRDSLERAEVRGPLEVARTTFAQNYQASRSSFLKNDVSIARQQALTERMLKQRQRAKGLGVDLAGEIADRVDPGDPRGGLEDLPGRGFSDVPFVSDAQLRAEYDRRVGELNARLPKGEDRFLTLDELRQRVVAEARAAREQAEALAARAGTGGAFGGFVGTAVGSIHDPINIGVMVGAAPLAAQSLLSFALTEAALSGGSELVIQTQVVPFLEEQGLSREEAIAHAGQSVLAATLMGGLLGGTLKIGGKAVAGVVKRVRGGKPQLDLDGILAEYDRLEAEGKLTPEQGDALSVIKEAHQAQKSNTFGDTPEGIDRHVQNLGEAEAAAAEGRRTAVSRPAREGLDTAEPASPRSERVAVVSERRAGGQEAADIRAKYRLHDFEDLLDAPEFREVAQVISRETLDDIRKGVPALEAQTLIEAIKKLRGIRLDQEMIADLADRGVTPKTAPGLFRKGKGGRDLDELREDLHAIGFFPEKRTSDELTIDELVDAIGRDKSGDRVTNASVNQILDRDARARNAEEAERFLDDLGVDFRKESDREIAFDLREKLLARAEQDSLEAHEQILSRLAPDRAELEAEAFNRLADDIDARLSEVEGRVSIDEDGNVVLNAQESAAFPAEDIRIALEDGTILSARDVLDLQAERAKAIEDFTACALGVAAE